jgi:hypothetical protein
VSRPDPDVVRFRYPDDWPEVVDDVRGRAGDRCECRGECCNPFCSSSQDAEHRCKVQELRHYPRHTVVPLDHNPSNAGRLGERPNLRAFCPACTDAFRYDLKRRHPQDPAPARARAEQTALEL